MANELTRSTAEIDTPRASSADTMLSDVDLPLHGIFHPLGFSVEIRTNEPGVLEAANESWGHLQARGSSAIIQIRITITNPSTSACPLAPIVRAQGHLLSIVADAQNHATCDLRAGFAFACITRAAVRHRLYFRYHFLESMVLVLLSSIHAPALHAACVSRHGRGLLFYGESGAGKSTLAYACARAGFTYTTDDASYLLSDSEHPRVVGHSHQIRFRPTSRELFPELGDRELTPRLVGKPSIEVLTSELPGIITAEEAQIHYLILLRRKSGVAARLVPVATSVALKQFEAALYPVEEIRRTQIIALQQLATTRAFDFHYSDLEEAIYCLDRLTRGDVPIS